MNLIPRRHVALVEGGRLEKIAPTLGIVKGPQVLEAGPGHRLTSKEWRWWRDSNPETDFADPSCYPANHHRAEIYEIAIWLSSYVAIEEVTGIRDLGSGVGELGAGVDL